MCIRFSPQSLSCQDLYYFVSDTWWLAEAANSSQIERMFVMEIIISLPEGKDENLHNLFAKEILTDNFVIPKIKERFTTRKTTFFQYRYVSQCLDIPKSFQSVVRPIVNLPVKRSNCVPRENRNSWKLLENPTPCYFLLLPSSEEESFLYRRKSGLGRHVSHSILVAVHQKAVSVAFGLNQRFSTRYKRFYWSLQLAQDLEIYPQILDWNLHEATVIYGVDLDSEVTVNSNSTHAFHLKSNL